MALFRTLYARLAGVLLILLLALGTAFAIWAARAALTAAEAADQSLNRDLATELAPRFQMYLDDGIPRDSLEAIIAGLSSINRRIDVYLLGSTGMVKAALRMPRDLEGRVVDTRPLDRMIAGAVTLPLRAEDPRQPGQARPFSAAHVRIMGEEGCYLYIVLGNSAYDASLAATARGLWAQGALRFLPVALLVTAALGLFLFAGVTRPLRRLAATAEAIGGGDLDRRVPVTGDDEVGRLGTTFNRMADALADTLRRLEQTDRERRELVASVSHDLRSPLAAVRGYLETALMKGEGADPAEVRRYVEVALRNTEGLGSLVEELFELSKLDAGVVQPRMERFAAADLVQDVAARFRPRAEQSGQHLALALEERLPLVRGDIGLIERVIANLVDNALRYTPAGGTVELVAAPADGGATIRVRDSGSGIRPELLDRVTERFVQGDPARTRGSHGGAGLGLAIAERILALHNTTLRIESAPNEGTTVSFHLSESRE